jgi:uncharacterized membrane protein YqaE (UPF0057 family)
MMYLLAIILPPIAVLICGKPIQAILNLILTLIFWIPGMIHALFVVHGYYADKRTDKIVEAIEQKK